MIEIFEVIAPVFLITMIGYGFGRSKVDLHVATLSTTVILVAMPALVFSSLTSFDLSLQSLGFVSAAAILCLALSLLLSFAVVRVMGYSVRTFLPSLAFPNSGNMGLPLALMAFGEVGLGLAVAYFVVVALVQHTLGVVIASGQYSFSALLRQPLIYVACTVLVVIAADLTVPPILATTSDILGGMMIPAMLILLGNSLASLKVSDFGPATIMALARLAIGVSAGFATISLLGLTGTLAGIVFLLSAMPSAVVTYVYAERFRPDPEKVAGSIVLSTILTFCLLPALIWGAQYLAQH